MKKKYEKPRVYMEQFKLAEHIAGCNLTLESGDVDTCDATGTIGEAYLDGSGDNLGWFVNKGICGVPVHDYCYTNGTSTLTTINS